MWKSKNILIITGHYHLLCFRLKVITTAYFIFALLCSGSRQDSGQLEAKDNDD